MVIIHCSFSHIFSWMFGLLISTCRSLKTFISVLPGVFCVLEGPSPIWGRLTLTLVCVFFVHECVLCFTRMLAERRVSTLCLSPRTFSRPHRWSLRTFKEICASWGKTSVVWLSSYIPQPLNCMFITSLSGSGLAMPYPARYARCHIMFKIPWHGNVCSNKFCINPCTYLLAQWKVIFQTWPAMVMCGL